MESYSCPVTNTIITCVGKEYAAEIHSDLKKF